ncbi:MAG: hypothetical protein Q7T59_01170 [Candidatus Woesebacteria bacterium]|nr:hypothetical protein [Candidatus Woesebacteria bacterium]
MPDCCSKHLKTKRKEIKVEEEPKSFFAKFLYKLGKDDFEKNKDKKRNCCLVK